MRSSESSQDDTAPGSRQTTMESVLVSEALFEVVGRRTYQSMAEVIHDVWSYVREHNLQESEDKLVANQLRQQTQCCLWR
jgi:chromatin remodeling complex protein RSC6